MASTSRLYHALHEYLSQYQDLWRDVRHLQTLCWMMIGILQSQNVHLNGFGVHVVSRESTNAGFDDVYRIDGLR